MATRDINDCDPILKLAWENTLLIWDHPVKPFLTCCYRSDQEQAELYAIGRTVPGKKVTNAKPGQSKHNLKPSKAFDIAFKNPGGSLNWDAKLFRLFYEKIKTVDPRIIWGGNFKNFSDRPHFEI